MKTSTPAPRSAHPYHLWESIMQTPADLEACFQGPTWDAVQTIAEEMRSRDIQRVILSGTGSSYYAAVASGFAFQQLTGLPVVHGITSELGAYPPLHLSKQDMWLFISHSGGTMGDEPVVSRAKEQGVFTIGVTDVTESPLALHVDRVLLGPGGKKPELPATRTYSAAIFRMILLAASAASGASRASADELLERARHLPALLKEVSNAFEEQVGQVVQALSDCRYFVFLSSGPNVATAHEGALGFSQSLDAQAQGFALEEWLHGPVQTLTPDMGVVLVAPDGPRQARMLDIVRAVEKIGSKRFVLAPDSFDGLAEAEIPFALPVVPELLSPVMYISPLWQTAYRFAVASGRNPDRLSMDQEPYQDAMDILMSKDIKFTGQRNL